ncbi:MAG: hypothetical protein A3I13_00590 [Gammaproteobacteria bacterium RIFCSPLOWO2_02_FULL_47_50]|jgi:hypothetical protein|nr:MAG: hypothetical protein A2993_01815 [Gammaproteobacteria bacterium RIFCSPLOWO2_01_FULL_47_190]OGT75520.1 MAG: hypothetical protein A2W76_10215 [Gammaproteobacteria bacterium RIFCSPLOWO2_12_47_11]OGT79116.1 MAG: hypothetical protein A3I13_00590 [Gammaproteobacteria bacterium RIFCSPLOWO2_02_FULL_47_50]OGT83965.1 MAG: hypothetical protein A3G42_06305 [Gammaproteobacteria bacterium RIFCSPLOWO2_12_FULL_47_76]
MNKKLILLGLLLCLGFPLYADEVNPDELEDIPEPPALPDPVESGEAIEPQVTIIQRDDATIEEYRVNGVLYSVKIIPVVGPAYYLVDRDGDGQLESRVNDITRDIPVPLWLIFSW